jgi:hypothetical protein
MVAACGSQPRWAAGDDRQIRGHLGGSLRGLCNRTSFSFGEMQYSMPREADGLHVKIINQTRGDQNTGDQFDTVSDGVCYEIRLGRYPRPHREDTDYGTSGQDCSSRARLRFHDQDMFLFWLRVIGSSSYYLSSADASIRISILETSGLGKQRFFFTSVAKIVSQPASIGRAISPFLGIFILTLATSIDILSHGTLERLLDTDRRGPRSQQTKYRQRAARSRLAME